MYENPDTIKVNLVDLRHAMGLTIREMAPIIGNFSFQTYHWREKRGELTLAQYLRLEKYLKENKIYAHQAGKRIGQRVKLENYTIKKGGGNNEELSSDPH